MSDESATPTPPVDNRMQDCGDGRHVGWWTERLIDHRALLIEVTPHTVMISCCEGECAEKRISFIVGLDKAVGIVRAMAKALNMEINDGQ